MRRFLGALAALAFVLSAAGQARAANILYFTDGNVAAGTDQMLAALDAMTGGTTGNTLTVASTPLAFAADIAKPGAFQLGVFSQQQFSDFSNPYTNGKDYSTALAALATFIHSPGTASIVNTFNPDGFDYISAFGANYTGNVWGTAPGNINNLPQPVMPTGSNPGVISNPLTLTNPGETEFAFGLSPVVGGAKAATFVNGDGAIVVDGNSTVNGFLNDTVPGPGLFENEISSALAGEVTTTPEPATLTLIGLGIGGMLGYSRLRRQK